MSRIGKKPIQIPQGVTVQVTDDKIIIKGPKGQLEQYISPQIKTEVLENQIVFSIREGSKDISALWGLSRALVNNMIVGATKGFEKKLEIEGVGYKAAVSGNNLTLNIGFSHPVIIKIPSSINLKVEKNIIIISGIDKYLVGQVAANIRAKKKPEPYKGKGIHYLGEVIRRKAGKKAAVATV